MTWLYGLRDPRDQWLGVDKEAHLFGAAFAACAFGWPLAVLASLAIEAVEVVRWMRLGSIRQAMVERGAVPWPVLTDRVSLKDLAADALGILLAVAVMAL